MSPQAWECKYCPPYFDPSKIPSSGSPKTGRQYMVGLIIPFNMRSAPAGSRPRPRPPPPRSRARARQPLPRRPARSCGGLGPPTPAARPPSLRGQRLPPSPEPPKVSVTSEGSAGGGQGAGKAAAREAETPPRRCPGPPEAGRDWGVRLRPLPKVPPPGHAPAAAGGAVLDPWPPGRDPGSPRRRRVAELHPGTSLPAETPRASADAPRPGRTTPRSAFRALRSTPFPRGPSRAGLRFAATRAQMAKWLRDYLSFGGRRPPPQPPTPDYTESDILRAYLEQKNLDFEDPYEDADGRLEPDPAGPADSKYDSPKHRLIKVDAADMAEVARAKVLLGSAGAESEVDTEYSDPFDAQPHQPPPDDGYMEPYDAQRVVSELPCRTMQLYDTPYEEQDGEPGDRPLSGQRPRQSRLPQEDERPADEYDQPWEWKKDHISKAFAVQFDSPEWERTSGSAKELRRHPPRSPHPAERVDPALPLEKQPWFHGPLSRADAENLLLLCKEGSYLVRLSETSPQDCSLSLRSSQGFLHLKFARTRENQLVLGQHSGPFASVPELVLHYSSRPLPVQGAEHLALLYPVVTQGPCPGASAPCPAP